MVHGEALLHALWRELFHLQEELFTIEGKRVEVLDLGHHNGDAGPDFQGVQLKIDGVRWVGDVEMHLRTSDWNLHGHHTDPKYNAVVLHVVAVHDAEVQTCDGRTLTTVVFPHLQIYEKYQDEIEQAQGIPPCGERLVHVEPVLQKAWKDKLLTERLAQRAAKIDADRVASGMDWEEAFYRSLARTLGLTVNQEAMYALAAATPLKALYKVRDERRLVEAILHGQSGLLPLDAAGDEYTQGLSEEYDYQRARFGLTPLDSSEWKFLRLRPSGFPSIRVSQLAGLITEHDHLFSQVVEAKKVHELLGLFTASAEHYWDSHYRFGESVGRSQPKRLGRSMQELLLLNSALPFRYAYALCQQNQEAIATTLSLYTKLGAEKNQIIEGFRASGVTVENAAESQALLQLYKLYCRSGRCHLCPAWRGVLTKN